MKNITQISKIAALLIGLFLGANSYSQVGIGTTAPTTTLDVNGAVSLREGAVLTLVNGNNNNIALGATPYSVYRIAGPTAYFSVTGIARVSAASNGQMVTLINTTTNVMRIANNATSTAANRILVPGGQDFYLYGQYSSVTLIYNSTLVRWVVLNKIGDITKWYTPTATYTAGTTTTYTVLVPNCTSISGVSVNLVGDWLTGHPNVVIEAVEAMTGAVRFKLYNYGATTYTGMDFEITVIN